MADGHKDYSATPLWTKLGIGVGSRVLVIGAPEGFAVELERLAPLPPEVEFLQRSRGEIDVGIVFASRQQALARGFERVRPHLASRGRLWVAWPKKASKVPTDVTFGSAQALGLDAGLVDNKTAAVDPTFQGLQFVHRVGRR